jgi:fatty-acyl-CoA synthase
MKTEKVGQRIRTFMTQHQLQSLTLGQILDRTVATRGDRDALIYVDRDFRRSYKAFSRVVDQLAQGLMALGVKKREKVAVWATNIPYWVTLQFATAKIGAVLLTVNTNYKTAELAYLLEQSDTETLFIIDGYQDTDYIQTVYHLVPELKVQERGRLISQRFPCLRRVCFLGQEKHRGIYSHAADRGQDRGPANRYAPAGRVAGGSVLPGLQRDERLQ